MADVIYTGDGGLFKVCASCREAKPMDGFPTNRNKPHGRGYKCRDCVNTGRRERRAKANGYVDGARVFACEECGESAVATSGRQKYCTQCSAGVIRASSTKGGFKFASCVACGEEFMPNSGAQKYCSLPCRDAVANATRRTNNRNAGKNVRGEVFACEECGDTVVRRSGMTKWCEECRPAAYKSLNIAWRKDNLDKIRARKAEYRKDPRYNLDSRMGCAIWQCLREVKSGRTWETLVGYTLSDLMRHLERQFVKGMGWHNISEWHVDHIIPKSLFVYETDDDPEFRACWAITNLRPLWSADNLTKGPKRLLLI